jgi:tRNA threonylcarbamoyladenosine modification (KEOPS) complex  Pcc1 subunit
MMQCKVELDYSVTLQKALEPELKGLEKDRSTTSIKKDGKRLIIIIEAKDSVALRAAFNSITKLVTVYEKA